VCRREDQPIPDQGGCTEPFTRNIKPPDGFPALAILTRLERHKTCVLRLRCKRRCDPEDR
jgi:hypothetical protein